jgi:CHAD domain-containing protein
MCMSYRLSFDEPLPKTLNATALELFEHATGAVRDDMADDPVEAVHEVRKDLKKARSMLRLVRPAIPGKVYRRENRRLRDAARDISGARDADVMVETVDKLAERYVGRLPKRAFTTLRRRLAKDATGSSQLAGSEELLGALEAARARVGEWTPEGCDGSTLRAGAIRAYTRGRDALAAAERDPSAENLHEWRKRVKDLWYHQRLLRNAWKDPLKTMAGESHRLADLLGDDHDLAVLADRLGGSAELTDGSALLDRETMLTLIAERRGELQAEALDLGRRVYAEKPKAYGRRLARYMGAARADRPAPVSAPQ